MLMSWARIAAAALAGLFFGVCVVQAEPRVFRIDGEGARLTFSCDVLGMVPMEGAFTRFVALIALDVDAPTRTRAVVTVDAASMVLSDPDWTDDLKGPGFFDVAHFPQFGFHSDSAKVVEPGLLSVSGTLVLRATSRPVVLHVRYAPETGAAPTTMQAAAEVDRSEFGMDAFRPVVSDDVDIEVQGQLVPAFPPFRAWR